MNPTLRAVVRSTVRTANTPLAKRRAKRSLAAAPRPLKLEIGGLEDRPGWVVTNVNAVTRNFMDATTTWPLEDASTSHVYSDNVIEHVPLEAGRVLFSEAHRCLQPGGVIRLVTPDLRAHIDKYLSGSRPAGDPGARTYESMGLTVEHPLDWVRIPIASFGHHEGYVYDFETLAAELERAGFHSVVRCSPGESPHPEMDSLDQRADEGGAQMAVEATR
ncbi:methyltransferase domain-containing protein [Aeromicrobium sp.]|uniref:class I SAM-dependent methyltransferase n=1 Tax=Aeromicrobium sp. TaxID=1871063 RepID=UPI00199C059F|nr:methyltransferase domain-containing protein [Aeromicrobium sp.]MBC7633674.1 methyltransferase domain-containing protein [Aeromicrobium sp.]